MFRDAVAWCSCSFTIASCQGSRQCRLAHFCRPKQFFGTKPLRWHFLVSRFFCSYVGTTPVARNYGDNQIHTERRNRHYHCCFETRCTWLKNAIVSRYFFLRLGFINLSTQGQVQTVGSNEKRPIPSATHKLFQLLPGQVWSCDQTGSTGLQFGFRSIDSGAESRWTWTCLPVWVRFLGFSGCSGIGATLYFDLSLLLPKTFVCVWWYVVVTEGGSSERRGDTMCGSSGLGGQPTDPNSQILYCRHTGFSLLLSVKKQLLLFLQWKFASHIWRAMEGNWGVIGEVQHALNFTNLPD